jgi:tRNA-specific 2-thiouridylase
MAFSGCRCPEETDTKLTSSVALPTSRSAIVSSDTLEPKFKPTSGLDLNPERSSVLRNDSRKGENQLGILLQAVDKNKDQTYFLYRVTGEAMGKTLFPVGEFTKPQVRKMANERGLTTAVKKDSQGICFIGQIGIRDFLSLYVDAKPGDVIDKKSGKVLGHHDGAIFYTFGQRHGMDLGGGMPYYVVGKDMDKNEVYVTTDLNDDTLWKKTIKLTNLHWINNVPADGKYQIRVRHRAPLADAKLSFIDKDDIKLELDHPERAIAPGQSVVIYDGDTCLGGGIIT